jgi:hypothetical protein
MSDPEITNAILSRLQDLHIEDQVRLVENLLKEIQDETTQVKKNTTQVKRKYTRVKKDPRQVMKKYTRTKKAPQPVIQECANVDIFVDDMKLPEQGQAVDQELLDIANQLISMGSSLCLSPPPAKKLLIKFIVESVTKAETVTEPVIEPEHVFIPKRIRRVFSL